MEIKIVERKQSRIIGMKLEVLLQDTREHMIIPKFQKLFNTRLNEVNGAIGLPTTYGIFIDPPNYNPDTDLFTWIAGVEVNAGAEPPVDMIVYDLPKSTYALLEYKGDIDSAGNAYGKLYEWITNSEFEQAGSYGFEMYSTVHSQLEQGFSNFVLHFPIRKK